MTVETYDPQPVQGVYDPPAKGSEEWWYKELDIAQPKGPAASWSEVGSNFLSLFSIPQAIEAIPETLDGIRQIVTGERQYVPGERGSSNREFIQSATDAAGMAMTASLPIKRPSNSIGTFGGRLGAENLDKTTRPDQVKLSKILSEAETLRDAGVSPDDIRVMSNQLIEEDPIARDLYSGVHFGPDGKPRFELSDHQMSFTEKANTLFDATDQAKGKIGDLIDHPILFKAYPELKDRYVHLRMSREKEGKFILDNRNMTAGGPGFDSIKEALAHEIQHYIQDVEGLPQGGSPDVGNPLTLEVRGQYMDEKRLYQNTLDKLYSNYAKETNAVRKSKLLETIGSLTRRYKELNPDSDDLMNIYRRMGGENEATATENRRSLTAEQRRNLDPSSSMDVPIEDQLVPLEIYRKGKAAR